MTAHAPVHTPHKGHAHAHIHDHEHHHEHDLPFWKKYIFSTDHKWIGVQYTVTPSESSNLVFRRSLFVVADVVAGESFTEKNVRSIRPGHGIAPRFLGEVLGRRAARAVKRGTPLTWDLVAG